MDDDFEEDFIEDIGPDEDNTPTHRPSNLSQHTLLGYLVANPDVWARVEPILKPEYFDEEYSDLVSYVLEHSNEYHQIPSRSIIRMKTGVLLDRYNDAQESATSQWLLDETQTFCRHRATVMEVRRAAQVIQKDTSRAALEQIFQNIKGITEISIEKDLGLEVHRDARRVLGMKQEEITKPSGYKHLDRVSGGGFPVPGLVMFAGTSGLGKSVVLTNLGVQYCQKGDFVVYVSLELDEPRIFQRVSSIMTEVPIRRMNSEQDKIVSQLEYRLEIGDGLYCIKKMKMSGTTCSHIHAYLKELCIKEGRKPDVLILDYLDLLYPKTRMRDMGNIHIKDKYTAEELYDLLREWGLLGLTASQMVKNNAELDDFDHANLAGGTPKINTVDYGFALRRKDHELWAKCMKGRYGGEGAQIPFDWNMDTLRITDGSDEMFHDKNPRYDPDFYKKASENNAILQRSAINKDARRVQSDDVLEKIKRFNVDSLSDPYAGELE